MLSEDKISHLSHVILQAIKKSSLVTVQADEGRVLKEIKRVLASELAQEEDIDQTGQSEVGLLLARDRRGQCGVGGALSENVRGRDAETCEDLRF